MTESSVSEISNPPPSVPRSLYKGPLGAFTYILPPMAPIFVTGPQRSGTTIAARILAADLNRTYVDEAEYTPSNLPKNAVIQAPFIIKFALELSYMFPKAHFVFMERDKEDIVKSMEKIEWYKDYIQDAAFYKPYVEHTYRYIDLLCETLPKDRWSILHYDSLTTHPLFVKDRHDFTVRQWQKDKPEGPTTWRNDDSTGSYKVRLQDVPSSSVATIRSTISNTSTIRNR
jgi:hypothetical protein